MPGTMAQIVPSIPEIIGTVNGESWLRRWGRIHSVFSPATLREHVTLAHFNLGSDLTGSDIYAKEAAVQTETRYDIVNAWQVNYVRGTCAQDGSLMEISTECYSDDALFGHFYAKRKGATVLDVGCNTGKNMTRARQHGGPGTEVYGLEYSPDSVALASKTHGKDRVFLGDASDNFVDKLAWQGKFSVVQCTAVLQHMRPEQVEAALGHISGCLAPGGEFLVTFKDAPTKDQMRRWGMGRWIEEVFTADVASREEYLRDGFLRSVMWDDDYYPNVTSSNPPVERDFALPGLHRREFVFYSLEWITGVAVKNGLFPTQVEVHLDSKIPYSALHWMVVFRSTLKGDELRSLAGA